MGVYIPPVHYSSMCAACPECVQLGSATRLGVGLDRRAQAHLPAGGVCMLCNTPSCSSSSSSSRWFCQFRKGLMAVWGLLSSQENWVCFCVAPSACLRSGSPLLLQLCVFVTANRLCKCHPWYSSSSCGSPVEPCCRLLSNSQGVQAVVCCWPPIDCWLASLSCRPCHACVCARSG